MTNPDLTTRLAPNLTLPTPFLAASGTFGYGEAADLTDFTAFGALITPTLTLEPHGGNPPPRTEEANGGLLHATGLPNPGLTAFLAETLPRLQALPCPCIVSIHGGTESDWETLATALSEVEGLAALELNLSPPQLLFAEHTAEPLPTESETLERIQESISIVKAATTLPLLAKLPSVGADIARAAQAAVEAGADVVCVGQAFPGIAVRTNTGKFRFPGVVGGLSGPAIKPLALYQVWRASQAVQCPILGSGGILTVDDALEFFLAGATAVSIGLGNLVHPDLIPRLTADLRAYLTARNMPDLTSLVGAA